MINHDTVAACGFTMLRVASLGSGSKGNGTLIDNGETCVLIDLGFTLKEIKELLALRIVLGATRADVRMRAEAKLFNIEEKIWVLRAMKKSPRRLTVACPCPGRKRK